MTPLSELVNRYKVTLSDFLAFIDPKHVWVGGRGSGWVKKSENGPTQREQII